jgi:hypothetical protein
MTRHRHFKFELYKTILVIGLSFVMGVALAAAFNRKINFFFYCTFIGSIAASAISFTSFKLIKKKKKEKHYRDLQTEVLCSLVSGLLAFSFLATVPLNVDRSFSVWMLHQANQKQFKISELELFGAKYFSPENNQISRRINEQIKLGNVVVDSDYVKLTKSGKRLEKFHRLVRVFFGLDKSYAG